MLESLEEASGDHSWRWLPDRWGEPLCSSIGGRTRGSRLGILHAMTNLFLQQLAEQFASTCSRSGVGGMAACISGYRLRFEAGFSFFHHNLAGIFR